LGDSPENSSRNVTTTAYGDHEIWLKVIEDLVGGLLAEFVDLSRISEAGVSKDMELTSLYVT
jgi:hypothetical protein